MAKQNNENTYKSISYQQSSAPKRRQKQQNGKVTLDKSITNQWEFQKDLHTIGIYDHEWEALHNSVKHIKSECSKFNIGPILDGFGMAICIPLFVDFMKIINQKGNVANDIIVECKIYGGLLFLYIISLSIRKIFKPKWLTSYTRFDTDIKNLDDRMQEIEKRIGIEYKE